MLHQSSGISCAHSFHFCIAMTVFLNNSGIFLCFDLLPFHLRSTEVHDMVGFLLSPSSLVHLHTRDFTTCWCVVAITGGCKICPHVFCQISIHRASVFSIKTTGALHPLVMSTTEKLLFWCLPSVYECEFTSGEWSTNRLKDWECKHSSWRSCSLFMPLSPGFLIFSLRALSEWWASIKSIQRLSWALLWQ